MYPVCDILVILSNACDEYTNAVIVTDLPLGYDISLGNSYILSRYCSLIFSAELPENDVVSILVNLGSKYIVISRFFFVKANMWNT